MVSWSEQLSLLRARAHRCSGGGGLGLGKGRRCDAVGEANQDPGRAAPDAGKPVDGIPIEGSALRVSASELILDHRVVDDAGGAGVGEHGAISFGASMLA